MSDPMLPAPRPPRAFWLATAVLAADIAGLGALDASAWWLGPAAAATFVAVAIALARAAGGQFRAYAIAPGLVVLGLVAVEATPSPIASLLGGLGGLAVLAWVASGEAGRSTGRRLEGLLLPGLAVGIAYATSTFLPPAEGLAAVAFALVVVVVLAVAYVVGRPGLLGGGATGS